MEPKTQHKWKDGRTFNPRVLVASAGGSHYLFRVHGARAYQLCKLGHAEVDPTRSRDGRKRIWRIFLKISPQSLLQGPPTPLHAFNLSLRYVYLETVGYSEKKRLATYSFRHVDKRDVWAYRKAVTDCVCPV